MPTEAPRPSDGPVPEPVSSNTPPRRAPAGFCRKFRKRLALVALIDAERARFRRNVLTGTLAFAVAVGLVLLGAFMLDLHGMLARNIPGVMGYYDYFTASFGRAGGVMAILLGTSLGLMALFAMRPVRK